MKSETAEALFDAGLALQVHEGAAARALQVLDDAAHAPQVLGAACLALRVRDATDPAFQVLDVGTHARQAHVTNLTR